jgi:tRNA uridine 5-carboxymethylaminomethyl modification enzyme
MKHTCELQENLEVKQAKVVRLLCKNGSAVGVLSSVGCEFMAKVIVVTTGTFLKGLMHVGESTQTGGRAGESSASELSESLKECGLELGRFKTGTPPRLIRRTIDFGRMEIQDGDYPIPYFSFWRDQLFHVEHGPQDSNKTAAHQFIPGSVLARIGSQLPCYLTHTSRKTAEIIRSNLHRSPMYSGQIEGTGPRYCPSIEDKIVRFSEKEQHQIFLEPEGVETEEIYINGLSTSLPFDVQVDLVRSVLGCESAEIMRPAYAVEYDYAPPTQLLPSLEAKVCANLFLAGQINGTSGYEEAAAQGLMAGINATLRVKGREPMVLRRDQAYIGVLIDDLVTLGTPEPYRIFTSRAEYRMTLRQDNADLRLSEIGYRIGLLPENRYRRLLEKSELIRDETARLQKVRINEHSAMSLLSRPGTTYKDLPDRNDSLAPEVTDQIEISAKYSGYIERQKYEIDRLASLQNLRIPDSIDYDSINGLSTEAREKLSRIRPATFGQAARIPGVVASDLSLISVSVSGRNRKTHPLPSEKLTTPPRSTGTPKHQESN